jgi:DNA-directed RNA polymerase subunit RPC12/RpoP
MEDETIPSEDWIECPECHGKGFVEDMATPVDTGDPIKEPPTRTCPGCKGRKIVKKDDA